MGETTKCSFFKGLKRAGSSLCGELEGYGGIRSVSIEKGKCIAWSIGLDDIELSKENIESLQLYSGTELVLKKEAYAYHMEMKDGKTGTLRLFTSKAKAALNIIGIEPTKFGYDNPESKPLEWFTSEVGLEAFKTYMSPQSYILEEKLREEHKQNFSEYDFDMFLSVCHKDAKIPCLYFDALIANIDSQMLKYVRPHMAVVGILKIISKPYSLNDEDEPVPCKPIMSPEQTLSVDKNPLLYFVKNFKVFEMKDDAVGTAADKIALCLHILYFIANNIIRLTPENNKWLFEKDTYINDVGLVRNEKAFLKKCKELTEFPEYFDDELAKLG